MRVALLSAVPVGVPIVSMGLHRLGGHWLLLVSQIDVGSIEKQSLAENRVAHPHGNMMVADVRRPEYIPYASRP